MLLPYGQFRWEDAALTAALAAPAVAAVVVDAVLRRAARVALAAGAAVLPDSAGDSEAPRIMPSASTRRPA